MLKKYLYDNFIVILFCVAGLLVMGIAVYTSAFVFSLSAYFRNSVEDRLRFISLAASRLVTAGELAELNEPEDMEKPLFTDIRNRLIVFGGESRVKYVYFIRPVGEGRARYIVDNDLSDETVNLASEPVLMEDALHPLLKWGIPVVTGLGDYSPGYSGLLTAYTPIFDQNGAIAAVAGVDITDEQILYMRSRIMVLSGIIFISAMVVFCTGFLSFSINKKKQKTFLMQIRQQELMSELSYNFISSGGGDSSTLISEALRITGEFLSVDRVLIGIADADSPGSHAAYAWAGSGGAHVSGAGGLSDLVNSNFPLEQPENIPIIYCHDVRRDRTYGMMEAAGIGAFIWAPLYVEGLYWAVLRIEVFTGSRPWTESDRQLVGTVSSVIAGTVERNLREKERDAAREQAERASKAKGDFLANMSHEMRTPLNAIIGMTAIARNSRDLEKKEYCLNKIGNASAHLLGVINDILDMSKIEANKFDLSPVDFSFEKTLQKVVNVINFRVDEKHQDFSVHIDQDIPKVLYGDDQRLSQVIANLLSNAVKFTPEGGTIHLSAKLDKKEGDLCVIKISVTDSGIGISPEQQTRLFSSFEQADTSTSRKFGGTGLGLAISKRIVDMMNGSFEVVSELGTGATFTFSVQLLEAAGELEEIAPLVNWSGVRVLAVDDDPAIREYFIDIAGRLGFFCDTAADGLAALETIEQNGSYDVYFVDWKMPGLDGLGLSRRIKETGGARSVVIMMSAVDWDTVEDDAKQAGVNSFLPKPLFPSGIADCISRALGVEEQVAAAASDEEAFERFEGRRVLLAEDVDINREIVVTLLEPTGIEIDCAENGAEAVKRFEQSPESYHMIFMDVQMPEMDGYEATRHIRASEAPNAATIPIIAMTANVFKEDIEQCLEAGMNDHVGKPLDMNDVMDKLRRYL